MLSGGGAAGLAYIGFFKALEELELPKPDCIVGCSIGSIIGGLYASGKPVREMEAVFEKSFDVNRYIGGGGVHIPLFKHALNQIIHYGTLITRMLSGKGAEYHRLLFKTLLPELKTKYPLDDSRLAYGGYSLGGLAAVWSLFEYTDIPYIFSLCGSFWYPGFLEYCREHKVLHSNAAVYLLNGKREGGKHGNRLENAPKYAAEVHQALRTQIAHTTVVFDPFGHHDKMLERFRAVQQWLTECWQL